MSLTFEDIIRDLNNNRVQILDPSKNLIWKQGWGGNVEKFKRFCQALAQNTSLTILIFPNTGIVYTKEIENRSSVFNEECATALNDALMQNTHLKHLDMQNARSFWVKDCLIPLMDSKVWGEKIEVLKLPLHDPEEHVIERIIAFINRENTLKELCFSNTPYGIMRYLPLIEACINKKDMQILDISRPQLSREPLELGVKNKFINELVALIASQKTKHGTLVLNLSHYSFGDANTIAIAKALRSNPNVLRGLRMKGCNIHSAGALVLANMLEIDPFIALLDISCNFLDDKPVSNIINVAFSDRSKMKELDLMNTMAAEDSFDALIRGISTNRTIDSVSMEDNLYLIPVAKLEELTKALETNHVLKTLNLAGNSIGDKGAVVLADYLSKNPSLEQLNIRRTDINRKGVIALAKAMESNHTLLELDYIDVAYNLTDILDDEEFKSALIAIKSKLSANREMLNIREKWALQFIQDLTQNGLRLEGSSAPAYAESAIREGLGIVRFRKVDGDVKSFKEKEGQELANAHTRVTQFSAQFQLHINKLSGIAKLDNINVAKIRAKHAAENK